MKGLEIHFTPRNQKCLKPLLLLREITLFAVTTKRGSKTESGNKIKGYSTLKYETHIIMGWRVQGSNSGGGKIFGTRSDWRWAHPASCTTSTVSFPVVQRPERGVKQTPKSSAEVKQRIE